jgi:cytochrome c-type biogenesis protein CcmH/NrfF
MGRWRVLGSTAVAMTFAMALAAPVYAQSTMYDPSRSPGGHYHPPGELGDKLLIVEHALKCGCGSCSMDVHTCQFQMQCDTSPAWTQRILTELRAGETPEAIEAGFVADFGRTVLVTPPVEGFNLVGYFLPAVAIVTAGMLIGLFAKRGEGLRPAPVTELDLDDDEVERLRAELRSLDETEGPDW